MSTDSRYVCRRQRRRHGFNSGRTRVSSINVAAFHTPQGSTVFTESVTPYYYSFLPSRPVLSKLLSNFIVDSSPSTVATSASATDGTNEISTDLPTSTDTVAATLASFLSSE
ncbi:hypothetical protein BHE74_00036505 [Ensete ventricosum]|nr:hypothetical protein BHE74_00036505 [Ensete ventricosum]